MAKKYRERFHLTLDDVSHIESALRTEIAIYARVTPDDENFVQARRRTRVLSETLGRLHNQKIFYAQVNETDVPVA